MIAVQVADLAAANPEGVFAPPARTRGDPGPRGDFLSDLHAGGLAVGHLASSTFTRKHHLISSSEVEVNGRICFSSSGGGAAHDQRGLAAQRSCRFRASLLRA